MLTTDIKASQSYSEIIEAGPRKGSVTAPSSKSLAHRLLIAAALSDGTSSLVIDGLSEDIIATAGCLRSLGATVSKSDEGLTVTGSHKTSDFTIPLLNCNESGSTLRFLLPLAGALGQTVRFSIGDSLSKRPISGLIEVLEKHGVQISRSTNAVNSMGKLSPGNYVIPGNISSQYVSGLLFALPLLDGASTLEISGKIESVDYILMTEKVLKDSGIRFEKEKNKYFIPGGQHYYMEERAVIEGDWSSASFFLCMGALSEEGITVTNLNPESIQGDRKILDILRGFGAKVEISGNAVSVKRGKLCGQVIDASSVPDLVPPLSIVAAVSEGETKIINAGRLRLKESDRLESTAAMVNAVGGEAEILNDGLLISGKPRLEGGTVDSAHDHRIAMAAALAASVCKSAVTINDGRCIAKSYPDFRKAINSLELMK